MKETRASIWPGAPQPGIPDVPALLSDSETLWLAYEAGTFRDRRFAVVRFSEVIDHHLSPINDEGLSEHPYARAGLQRYSFNELTGSIEGERWSVLGARHWVITFKDVTLDVLAAKAELIGSDIQANNALAALLLVIPGEQAQPDAAGDAPKPAHPLS